MPIGSMGSMGCDVVYVVGGINYSTTGSGAAQHWYQDYFPSTWNQYGPVTVAPML